MATHEIMTQKISTGRIKVVLTDEFDDEVATFKFNPSDTNILHRHSEAVDRLSKIELGDTEKMTDEERLETIKRVDNEIRDTFDFLLDGSVAADIFAHCGPLTPTGNGDFFFECVFDALTATIEKTTNQRVEKKIKRIKAATSKYHK